MLITGIIMPDKKLLPIGLSGLLIMVLCCFTPLLVILFGAVGISAALAYADIVLLPLLFFFIWGNNA